jgi:hypothetical protein
MSDILNLTDATRAIMQLQRAITTSTGLKAYDLQAPAKELIPLVTPLRNMIPRVKGRGDVATQWKAITGVNTARLTPGISEGNRNASSTTGVTNMSAVYKSIGFDDSVTVQADLAALEFTSLPADVQRRLLLSLMISEEAVLFGGQSSWGLGLTPTPTVGTSTTGGSVAAATYNVYVAALTTEGLALAGGVGNSDTADTTLALVIPYTRTNMGTSSTDTIPGGVAQPSAAGVQVTTGATSTITWSVAPVQGAAAYAVFVGVGAGARLYGIYTVASGTILRVPTTSQTFTTIPNADNSANPLEFDGLLGLIAKPSSGSYFLNGTGASLTSDGAAGIVELNNAFNWFWTNWKLSPTDVWCSGNMAQSIDKLIVANSGAPILRVDSAPGGDLSMGRPKRTTAVLNKITNDDVVLHVHPNCPDGTILFSSDKVPFPSANMANPVEVHYQRDYFAIDWPMTRLAYEYGVYAVETMAMYAPGAFGAIQNVHP